MTERLGEPLTVTDLAAEVRLSPYHFLRTFRRAVGETPHRRLVRMRLAEAKRLLESGATVADTARRCGFSSSSHFSAVFLREIGMRPSQWVFSPAASYRPTGRRP